VERCEEVAAWAAEVAAGHGLNCYDPQRNQLRTDCRDAWRFELTSESGWPVRDPSREAVRQALTTLSRINYFVVLTRADGRYVQVGYGTDAGTRPGWYALERRDGGPDRHYRTELTDIGEVVHAFVGFLDGDPTLTARFAWRPYAV
jgi:hypothetical protein